MNHFIIEVKETDYVLGFDIYDPKKCIVNYKIKPGFYLAYYHDIDVFDIEEDLIYFLYGKKILMIRKKLANLLMI